MTLHFYSQFFENEVASLEILVQKAEHNSKKRKRMLAATRVQLTYIKQLAASLFTSSFLEEVFSELELALKAALTLDGDFMALRRFMAGFRRELMAQVARLPSGITASWAHIYSADNHAITSRADPSGIVISVNRKFSEISGYPPEELVGEDHAVLNSGIHPHSFFADMWKEILAGRTWKGTVCNRNKGGGYYWVESSISPVFDDEGGIAYFASIRTERKSV